MVEIFFYHQQWSLLVMTNRKCSSNSTSCIMTHSLLIA